MFLLLHLNHFLTACWMLESKLGAFQNKAKIASLSQRGYSAGRNYPACNSNVLHVREATEAVDHMDPVDRTYRQPWGSVSCLSTLFACWRSPVHSLGAPRWEQGRLGGCTTWSWGQPRGPLGSAGRDLGALCVRNRRDAARDRPPSVSHWLCCSRTSCF